MHPEQWIKGHIFIFAAFCYAAKFQAFHNAVYSKRLFYKY